MEEEKETEREAGREGETDALSEHNGGETERGAVPEELVERKPASSDVVEEKEGQRGARTWPGRRLRGL